MIDTEILQIVIGVPKARGDTLSAEQGIRVLPFILNGKTTSGFAIDPERPWQPNRPALKGGQFQESALADGRQLAGNAVQNVIETIILTASAGNRLMLETRLNEMGRFIENARRFTSTFYQIEPVYIEWAALGGKGSQYALIYNMDMQVDYKYPGTGADAQATITLVIEREPAWRGVPPGVSAKVWTQYIRGNAVWNYTDLDWDDGEALVTATIQNRTEYDVAVDNYDYPSVSKNWVEIDGSLIPGDAPALVSINLNGGTDKSNVYDWHIARGSKPLRLAARPDSFREPQFSLNFTDANIISGGSMPSRVTDTTNGNKNADTGTQEVVEATFPSDESFGFTAIWGGSNVLIQRRLLDFTAMRGRYNLILRARFDPANVTFGGQITIREILSGADRFINYSITTGITTNPVLKNLYLGTITLPVAARADAGIEGAGLSVQSNNISEGSRSPDFQFSINDFNADEDATVKFIDIIFLPFDEPAVRVQAQNKHNILYDSTGYITRSNLCNDAMYLDDGTVIGSIVSSDIEVSGQTITLIPGTDNRLIIWSIDTATGTNRANRRQSTVKVDIVPRWYGVRDA